MVVNLAAAWLLELIAAAIKAVKIKLDFIWRLS